MRPGIQTIPVATTTESGNDNARVSGASLASPLRTVEVTGSNQQGHNVELR
jgi:hypothetical protein